MNTRALRSVSWIILVLITCACNATSSETAISISKGKHGDYYHIPLLLRHNAFIFSKDESGTPYIEYTKQALIDNGGQFELLIPVETFPISAPGCRKHLKLRMPWTNPDLSHAASAIDEKAILFDRLKQLKNGETGPVKVIIELNPYVKMLSRSPLVLELTQCNVFFRHARGRYIDHL